MPFHSSTSTALQSITCLFHTGRCQPLRSRSQHVADSPETARQRLRVHRTLRSKEGPMATTSIARQGSRRAWRRRPQHVRSAVWRRLCGYDILISQYLRLSLSPLSPPPVSTAIRDLLRMSTPSTELLSSVAHPMPASLYLKISCSRSSNQSRPSTHSHMSLSLSLSSSCCLL